jgi:hypothetical protein
MKVLISGDRDWVDYDIVEVILRGLHEKALIADGTLEIVEGEARGADIKARKAGTYIMENFHTHFGVTPRVEISQHYAKWNEYGKAAGVIRNQEMLDTDPDVVIAFHNNISDSKGTKDMINRAKKAGKPVFLVQQVEREIE